MKNLLLFFMLAMIQQIAFANQSYFSDCSAEFSFTSSDPLISFESLASGSISSYSWSFGDGTYSTEENTEHIFSLNGTYTVCLTVYGFTGTDSCLATTCQEIEITNAASCLADFYFYSSSSSSLVSFIDASITTDGSIDMYAWDFGDGTTSSEMNPEHIFLSSGEYDVCLTIFSSDTCTDVICKTITISDSTFIDSCFAGFYYSLIGSDVYFTNTSDGGTAVSVEYFWDFGDGSYSTLINPTHSFSSGIFEVCLMMFTSDSCESTSCTLLTIDGGIDSIDCEGGFTFSTDSLPEGTYLFDAEVAGGYVVSWDFGDGETSSESDPEYTYSDFGEYAVCMTYFCYSDSTYYEYCDSIDYKLTGISDPEIIKHFIISPIPAQNHIELSILSSISCDALISITDISGRKIIEKTETISHGSNTVYFDMQDYSIGMYLITIDLQGQGIVRRTFMKQ